MLSYKCPNKCVVYRFYGFICDFLEFPSVKFSKRFTVHWIHGGIRILNTKRVGFVRQFFRFLQIYVVYRCRKSGQIDFAEKRAPTKVKYLLSVCQILQNFTVGNARKFTASFAFCAHVDVIKYRKTLTFSIEFAQITWAFVLNACDRRTIGSHLKTRHKFLVLLRIVTQPNVTSCHACPCAWWRQGLWFCEDNEFTETFG